MPASEIVFKSAAELSPLLKARKLSPVEVVRAFLDRIEAVNPQVHAFITVTGEQALERARKAEQEIAAGHYRGPLHGVPYAPKDLLATQGIRTTNGSKATSGWIPDHESTVTARLNQAGAILIGKLNLLEFAIGSGQKGLIEPARNPWNLIYSPSGSSSGSGSAVAAGMVPLAIGSDTGGSIRGPAKSLRVGVPTEYFFDHVHAETEAALRRAISLLKEMGAVLVDVKVRNAALCGAASSIILNSEAAAFHEKRLKEQGDLLEPLVRE